MAFNEEEWVQKMRAAKTDEEFVAAVMELPDRSLDEMSEDEREFFIMEQKIESEFLIHITQTAKTGDG